MIDLLNTSEYFFNPHSVPIFLSAGLLLLLGIRVIASGHSDMNRYFAAVCLSGEAWLLCTGMGYLVRDNAQLAAFWFRLDWVGVSFLSINVYSFSASMLNLSRRKSIVFGYVIASVFAVITLILNPFMSGVKHFSWGYYPQRNIWNIPFFVYFFAYLNQASVDYVRCFFKTTDAVKKNQIKYMFLAFLIAFLSSIDYLPTYGFNVYPFGFLSISGFVAITAYAIVKHRLMDITVIIRKTLVYSTVMGSLIVVYLSSVSLVTKIFEGFSGFKTVFSSAVAAALITFVFQPLRKRVEAFVDTKFFRQYVDREEKLYELSRDVITHTTPEAMGKALQQVLMETFHPKCGVLFVRSRDGSGFSAATQWGLGVDGLGEESPLPQYFSDHPQPFLQELSGINGMPQDTRNLEARGRNA